MPRRPLAVVQFGQFPDGPLPARYDDSAGWGTVASVRMDAHRGDWPALHTAVSSVNGTAGRVVAGLLRPRRSTLTSVGSGAIGEAAIYRFAGLTMPAAGDLVAQLGTPVGVERPAKPSASAAQGTAVGLQTPDATRGVMAVWLDSLQVFFLYQWDGDGSDATVTYSADTPDATGIIGLRWADGEIAATLNGSAVRRNAADGDPIPAVTLPDDTSNLEPFLMAYQFGVFADSFGIAWAALTEGAPDRAPWSRPAEVANTTGWALSAATRDRRYSGEIPAGTWTWTWRLNDASEATWARDQAGGPRIRPHATHVQVRYNGRVLQTGPATKADETLPDTGVVSGTWAAGDRVAQLSTRVLYPTSTLAWVDVALGEVLRDLVGDNNELPGGDTGVRVDPDIIGPAITLTARPRDTVRAKIDEAVTLAGGEWWIDQGDVLRWSEAGRGGQRAFLCDHGGSVESVTKSTIPAAHGTALWFTGADSAVYRQAPDIADRPEGRVDLVASDPDQARPHTLAARADRAIGDAVAMRPALTCEMRKGSWEPSKLGPGDVARLVAPGFGVDELLRVYEISVSGTGDSAKAPTVKITFGAPRPTFERSILSDRRRIATLERR